MYIQYGRIVGANVTVSLCASVSHTLYLLLHVSRRKTTVRMSKNVFKCLQHTHMDILRIRTIITVFNLSRHIIVIIE